jgi:hypothetical protein
MDGTEQSRNKQKDRHDMNKSTRYVALETLLSLARSIPGLTLLEQSACWKVEAAKDRRIYIVKTKKCGRIDISNFECPREFGVKSPDCGEFGAVKQQLCMSIDRTEEQILSNLKRVLEHMLTLPASEKVKKVPVAKTPTAPTEAAAEGPQKIETVLPDLAELEAKRQAAEQRRLLIAKVAAEKGVAVSPRALLLTEANS